MLCEPAKSRYSAHMTSSPRLYVQNALCSDTSFTLVDEQAHYLRRVMRLGEGDTARIFNGHDGEWEVKLSLNGRKVTASPIRQLRSQPSGVSAGPILLFTPLKKTRTDFAVEKATELGVSVIQPVMTTRSQTHRIKRERLEALAIEAAEQTERMDVPTVCDLMPLTEALQSWNSAHGLIFCDEAGDETGRPWGGEIGRADAVLNTLKRTDTASGILIGPEGGFTSEEREALRALDFVMPVTLGPRILRAETAIVSALTIWQAVLGDWR